VLPSATSSVLKPASAQALAQVMAGFRLVFDDQQFHGRLGLNGTKLYTVGEGGADQPDKVVIWLSGCGQ
jgi:hypothetical protein